MPVILDPQSLENKTDFHMLFQELEAAFTVLGSEFGTHQRSVTAAAGVFAATMLATVTANMSPSLFSYVENRPHFPLFSSRMTLPNDQKNQVWWQEDYKFKAILAGVPRPCLSR